MGSHWICPRCLNFVDGYRCPRCRVYRPLFIDYPLPTPLIEKRAEKAELLSPALIDRIEQLKASFNYLENKINKHLDSHKKKRDRL